MDIDSKIDFCFNKLNQKILSCNRCNISPNRGLGFGNIKSKILFIAQNPGWQPKSKSEDIVPFGLGEGGKNSGKYLWTLLKKYNLTLNDFYITNIIKCPTPGNRSPNEKEIENCINYLKYEISIQNPKLIILMGSIAKNSFYKYQERLINHKDIIIRSIYHPAYLYRFKSKDKTLEWINKLNDINFKELKYV